MQKKREHWGSKLGFIFAAIGSAIGLGVLWKFPYVVGQNGGGYFLLTFLICILLIGIPVFVAELMIGRHTQKAAISSFGVIAPQHGFWSIGGWLGVIASFFIMSFYSVIAGYGMSYILMSLSGAFNGKSAHEISNMYLQLAESGDISVLWHFLFTVITMSIVFMGVRKGIEKWSKIMTRSLFVILILLVCFTVTLSGFKDAVAFIFYPNAKMFSFDSMIEALGLAFFILSLGQGIMISYGSYMKKGENLLEMGAIVGVSVIAVAILAALVVFPVVFTFNFAPKMGPGLIFQTLPFLFDQLPGSLILSTIFFTLFVFTALTSAIAFVEVVSTNMMELMQITRQRAVIVVGLTTFLFGLFSALSETPVMAIWKTVYGVSFLDNIDQIVSTWIIPLSGLFTALFVGWIMDHKLAESEFLQGSQKVLVFHIWISLIRYVAPVLIILIILKKTGLW